MLHRSIQCKPPSDEWRHIREKILNQAKKVCQELGVGVPRLIIRECKDIRFPGRIIRGLFRYSTRQVFLNRKHLVDEVNYEITFAHEVCHAICKKTPKGRREPAHGLMWQSIMKRMNQPVPEKYEDLHYDRKVAMQKMRRHREQKFKFKKLGYWKKKRIARKKLRIVQKRARRITRRHRGVRS